MVSFLELLIFFFRSFEVLIIVEDVLFSFRNISFYDVRILKDFN